MQILNNFALNNVPLGDIQQKNNIYEFMHCMHV